MSQYELTKTSSLDVMQAIAHTDQASVALSVAFKFFGKPLCMVKKCCCWQRNLPQAR
jgi:hypothetical protein